MVVKKKIKVSKVYKSKLLGASVLVILVLGLLSGVIILQKFGSLDPRGWAKGCPDRRCDKYQKPDGSYYDPTQRSEQQKYEGRDKYPEVWEKPENLKECSGEGDCGSGYSCRSFIGANVSRCIPSDRQPWFYKDWNTDFPTYRDECKGKSITCLSDFIDEIAKQVTKRKD